MEEFAKMVEAYRWTGDCYKKHGNTGTHGYGGGSPSSSFASASSSGEGAGSELCDGNLSRSVASPSLSSPSLLPCPMGTTKPKNDDDDDGGGGGGMLQRAKARYQSLSFYSGWYRPLSKHKPNRTQASSQASPHSCPTRQLVFSMGTLEGSEQAKKNKMKKETKKKKKKKKKKSGTKQSDHGLSSKECEMEVPNMPDYYDDSACEDGPTGFCTSSDAACTPDLVSQQRICGPQPHPEVANKSASKGRKRCMAVSSRSSSVSEHVANVKSHFFSHAKEKVKASGKKSIKSLPDIHISMSEECPAMTKTYSRKRRKNGSIKMNDVSTRGTDKVKQSSGHLSALKGNGSQSAHLSEETVVCSDAGLFPNKAAKKVRVSAYFKAIVKALGQRDIVNKAWVPPVSVHALIQEELYQDPWKVLVACMLLNKTSGTQMRRVIWDLFALCPTPEATVAVETEKIEEVIRPLGLQKKRARMIQKFSKDYLGKDWSNVGELHGIGKYARDAYSIFCEGRWREVKPEDHKLVDYWQYLCATDGLGYAFKDDREKGNEIAAQMSEAQS